MYPYAYLVWCLIFALVWIFLYWARRGTRREMLIMSICCTPLGPISEYFHVLDYWRPETITGTVIGPEDFIIAFLIGGISAAIYEWTYAVKREPTVRPGVWWYLFAAYAIGTGLLYWGVLVLGLTSTQVAVLLLSLFGIAAVAARPQLLKNAFFSSIAFGAFMFMFYQLYLYLYPGIIDAWWFGASGTRIVGVPIEEVAWGFLWGFCAGPMSELVTRLKLPRWTQYGATL
jgi:hypothetical protein